jgi:hypothetical protein
LEIIVAEPDPGSGASYLTLGSGIRNKIFFSGYRIPNPYFRELSDNFLVKKHFYNSLSIPVFFHIGSRTRIVSIPDLGSASKNLIILTQKNYPGCSSRIRNLTFYPSRIPDPRVKKAPDPGSATLVNSVNWLIFFSVPVKKIFSLSSFIVAIVGTGI